MSLLDLMLTLCLNSGSGQQLSFLVFRKSQGLMRTHSVSAFRAVTLKVWGINFNQHDLIADFFSQERLDFICTQETMVSGEASLTTLAQKWNGPSYWSPDISQRGWVAI